MGIFNDALPTQLVVVAPSRSVRWMDRIYLPGDLITLPTADAEALAVAGFISPPSPALGIALSPEAQVVMGTDNVETALLAIFQQLQTLAANPLNLPDGEHVLVT